MPSNAFTTTLDQMLRDAVALIDTYDRLVALVPPPQDELDAVTRAVVVACLSAWEAFVEELVIEAVEALRPPVGPLGSWPSHKATVLGETKRFNTPNPENVKTLLSLTLGLPDLTQGWSWPGYTTAVAVQDLTNAMRLRNQIAHGVNPRPTVSYQYASRLLDFFRELGLAADQTVRAHLVNALAVPAPWPP